MANLVKQDSHNLLLMSPHQNLPSLPTLGKIITKNVGNPMLNVLFDLPSDYLLARSTGNHDTHNAWQFLGHKEALSLVVIQLRLLKVQEITMSDFNAVIFGMTN
jgi:hypothetical protein